MGYTSNPFPYVKHALFTVLTSRFEGFPMTLSESLFLETPIVSVDCKSGPNEIIVNEFNGLLVNNYDEKALSNAFNRMINNKTLYESCKANAQKSSLPYDMRTIKYKWQEFLNNNFNK